MQNNNLYQNLAHLEGKKKKHFVFSERETEKLDLRVDQMKIRVVDHQLLTVLFFTRRECFC